MRFVEFTETGGATVLVNGAGVLFLRPAADGGTEVHFAGRGESLHLSDRPEDVARMLEESFPDLPPDPSLALVS